MLTMLAVLSLFAAPTDYVFAPADLSQDQVLSRHIAAVGGREQAVAAGDPLVVTAKDDAIVLLGISQVEGRAAYKIKITHADGAVEYHWIARDGFVELKRTAVARPAATPSPVAESSTPSTQAVAR